MPVEFLSTTILNKKKIPDPWFLDSYTLNPYSGCSFNCLYCYIRGSKYDTHMEEKLAVKTNAVELLEKQLLSLSKKNKYGVIVLSSATDPYLQFEKEYRLTRQLLEVILKYRFPVHVITKSDLVVRDFDLLKAINEKAVLPRELENKVDQKVFITFSFSTIDDSIARIFEPGATPPSLRLETLNEAVRSGFLSGVSMMPLLPYITDTGEHLVQMFRAFKKAGARYIFPATLTLFGNGPSDSRTLVFRAIEKYYPQLADVYSKLFSGATQLPDYYRQAFNKKAKELCKEYGLKDRIVNE